MSLKDTGDKISVDPEYAIHFAPGSHLILSTFAYYGCHAVTRFDHPTVLVKQMRVLEFKHYRRQGSKFWTSKAGLDFVFAVDKAAIEVPLEKGYSYVRVLIGGQPMTLNCSGGGGSAWNDWASHGCSLCGQATLQRLRALAAVSAPYTDIGPDKIPAMFDIHELKDYQQTEFMQLAARHDVQKRVKPGMQLQLRSRCSIDGSQGPFTITERPKRGRRFICDVSTYRRYRIRYAEVDWLVTAELNKIPLVEPSQVNRVGKVLPPDD